MNRRNFLQSSHAIPLNKHEKTIKSRPPLLEQCNHCNQINNIIAFIIICRPCVYQSNKMNNIVQLYLCNIYNAEYLWEVIEAKSWMYI